MISISKLISLQIILDVFFEITRVSDLQGVKLSLERPVFVFLCIN